MKIIKRMQQALCRHEGRWQQDRYYHKFICDKCGKELERHAKIKHPGAEHAFPILDDMEQMHGL